ncbi:MAG TPA: hypothetical protein VF704_07820 [Allosphingosinicella sp.]
MPPISQHLKRRKSLKSLGVTIEWWAHWRLYWSLAVVLALAVAAWKVEPSADNRDAPLQWLIPAILGAGVLIGSFFEWRSSRHEASLDKFYERLCIVNDSREKIRLEDDSLAEICLVQPTENSTCRIERFRVDAEGARVGKARPHVDPMQMYVWRELDNLEYLLERYRLGYLSTRLAFRGVATFASRFRFEQFQEVLGDPEDLATTAYNDTTIEVVKNVARDPDSLLTRNGPLARAAHLARSH